MGSFHNIICKAFLCVARVIIMESLHSIVHYELILPFRQSQLTVRPDLAPVNARNAFGILREVLRALSFRMWMPVSFVEDMTLPSPRFDCGSRGCRLVYILSSAQGFLLGFCSGMSGFGCGSFMRLVSDVGARFACGGFGALSGIFSLHV